MAQQPLMLKIIGIPHIPSIVEVNARPDAGTNSDILFKVPVGTTNVPVIDAKADVQQRNFEGKVYQWLRAQFPQGTAWVRDDLVEIWGDGAALGYPLITTPVTAFALMRDTSTIPHGAETMSVNDEPAAVPPTAATEVTTSESPSSETEFTPVKPATALIMSSFPAKLRPGPGTGHTPPTASLQYNYQAEILDTALGDDGIPLYWVKLRYRSTEGWTREDLLRLSGDFPAFGLNASNKYRCPAPESKWIRGWDKDGSIWNTGVHHGWDHAGSKGAPILAGPKGGVVFQNVFCSKCGQQGFSTVEKGYALYDSRVYSDVGWNFGYGHYIIVGYEHSKLPQSTQQYLADNGRAGQHIFVMYAHLQDMFVQAGQELLPNQQIGTLGNSGNSSGAHLHLEVRVSPTMQPQRWAAIKSGLMSPGVLFLR